MKNTILNKMRRLAVIFALCGMTFGILFPVNIVHRVAAEEKTPVLSEVIKPSVEQVEQQLGKAPVEFEENRGQFDKRVRFMARAAGSTIFLTADEAVYVLPMANSRESRVESRESEIEDRRPKTEDQKPSLAFALRMKIVGADVWVQTMNTSNFSIRTSLM